MVGHLYRVLISYVIKYLKQQLIIIETKMECDLGYNKVQHAFGCRYFS